MIYYYLEKPGSWTNKLRLHYLNTDKNARFAHSTLGELYHAIKQYNESIYN